MDYEDLEDDLEPEGEAGAWDDAGLELEWDEGEAQSFIRDLGITSAP